MKTEILRLDNVSLQMSGIMQLERFNLQIFSGEIMGLMALNAAWCIIVGVAAAIEYTGTLRAGLLLRTAGQQPYLQQDYTERDCRH